MNDGFNNRMKEIKEEKSFLRNSIITGVKNSFGLTGFIEIPDKSIISIIRLSNSKFQEVVLDILKQLSDCVKECIEDALEPVFVNISYHKIEHYSFMQKIFKSHLIEFVNFTTYETKEMVREILYKF
ncbi:hypothetical protein HZS_6312 [Henneguya salminicola]|nr:hypothetical protein HZS_6312 [Henneguya salminicola]